LSPDEVAAALASTSTASGRPEPVGPLAQLRGAQSLADDATIVLRSHLEPRLERHEDGARLTTRAGVLEIGPEDATVVEMLLAGDPVAAGTLGFELARRLLLAGVVVAT
jgi:hypothetical protein